MPIVLITPPVAEPVSLADAKLQIGLPPEDDGDHLKERQTRALLRRYIRSARTLCEDYTRRVFMTQTWLLKLDGWPYRDGRYQEHEYGGGAFGFSGDGGGAGRLVQVVLPKPPFQSIVTFTYVDVGGVTQDMTVWGFQLDPGSETQPARLIPPYLLPWPPTRLVPNSVQVQFKCGYGDVGLSVPQNILDAILLTVQYLYDGDPMKNGLPKIVTQMLDPHRNLVA